MPVQIQRVTIKTTVQNSNVNEGFSNKNNAKDNEENLKNKSNSVNQNKQEDFKINDIVETCLDEVKSYLKQLKEK